MQHLIRRRRCQLKAEYDLRGLKDRGEERRKEIIVTAHSKRIIIDKKVSKRVAELARKGRVSALPKRRDAGP